MGTYLPNTCRGITTFSTKREKVVQRFWRLLLVPNRRIERLVPPRVGVLGFSGRQETRERDTHVYGDDIDAWRGATDHQR